MASVIRVQVRRRSPKPPLVWLNRNSASRIEARALLVMVGRQDTTLETVRELISVPPEVEALLRAYALANPAEAGELETGLRFRRRVLEEFERLTMRYNSAVLYLGPAEI